MEQTQNAALIVLDVQDGIVAMLPESTVLLSNIVKAIAGARNKNIPVIYVVVGFRPGAPEVDSNNKSFGSGRERFANTDMAAFMKVHDAVAPQAGDITITKRRVSGFTGSDLEVVLRGLGVRHMVLTGIATSGAVLSTLREAADKDFKLTVLADCCGDGDEEVHRVLTTKVFPRQAEVLTVEDWAKL